MSGRSIIFCCFFKETQISSKILFFVGIVLSIAGSGFTFEGMFFALWQFGSILSVPISVVEYYKNSVLRKNEEEQLPRKTPRVPQIIGGAFMSMWGIMLSFGIPASLMIFRTETSTDIAGVVGCFVMGLLGTLQLVIGILFLQVDSEIKRSEIKKR